MDDSVTVNSTRDHLAANQSPNSYSAMYLRVWEGEQHESKAGSLLAKETIDLYQREGYEARQTSLALKLSHQRRHISSNIRIMVLPDIQC